MFGYPSGSFGDPIYVRQQSEPSVVDLIGIPLLLNSLYQERRQARAQAELDAARFRKWQREERVRRQAARREWECWVLQKKREWRTHVNDLKARGLPEPRYEEARDSKYGINLPGYPRDVVEFAERDAERGIYSGACVSYGQLWQWELSPRTIRRVRRMVREQVRPGIPQTVIDDARSMATAGTTKGRVRFAGHTYRWVRTGEEPNLGVRFLEVAEDDYDAGDDRWAGDARSSKPVILWIVIAMLCGLAVVIALFAGLAGTGVFNNSKAGGDSSAGSIVGLWIGEDGKRNRQVVRLEGDGSFSAGAVRNGDHQFTIFGRYEYTGDRLTVRFQNGATEWGSVEWNDRNTFRYTVQESPNSKLAVGKTIEYSRINTP